MKICRVWGSQASGSLEGEHSRRSEQKCKVPGVVCTCLFQELQGAQVPGRVSEAKSR